MNLATIPQKFTRVYDCDRASLNAAVVAAGLTGQVWVCDETTERRVMASQARAPNDSQRARVLDFSPDFPAIQLGSQYGDSMLLPFNRGGIVGGWTASAVRTADTKFPLILARDSDQVLGLTVIFPTAVLAGAAVLVHMYDATSGAINAGDNLFWRIGEPIPRARQVSARPAVSKVKHPTT